MPPRALLIAALLIAGGVPAGLYYAGLHHIPSRVVAWALPAVLLEILLYSSLAFEELRRKWTLPALVIAAPLPLLLAAAFTSWTGALLVAAMALVITGWFRWLPRRSWVDFSFIALTAAPVLFKLFAEIYPDPHPRLRLDFLGQLMWIRTSAAAVLNFRQPANTGFGFWPSASDWFWGLANGAAILGPILALNHALGFATPGWPAAPFPEALLAALGTFFGILWVVALSEELFFRGLLQQWVSQALRHTGFGLAVASLLFGAAHLGFRQFPNWRFAMLAALAGVAYGLAYQRTGGIRAAMVAHALVVTVWRTFFR
jgi:membrane protease YdiL (CAAX protease family)